MGMLRGAVCGVVGLAWICGVAVASPAPVGGGAHPPLSVTPGYRLGVGDKLRIMVFNEPDLTGEFSVNADGAIAFPLVGEVQAQGRTKEAVGGEITSRLANGYLRRPQVSIDVIGFRPFYILGEVNKPGEYPYEPGLTVTDAVAAAQGFTYRADKRHIYVKAERQSAEVRDPLPSSVPVHPGDTLRVGERFF